MFFGGKNPRVLIIEDEVTMQLAWERLLERASISVVKAFTTDEGWSKYNLHIRQFDAIAIDWSMPGSTLPILEMIRRIKVTYWGPMIATSSHEDKRKEMMKAGCTHEIAQKVDLVPFLTSHFNRSLERAK